jgi:hypothetical protein
MTKDPHMLVELGDKNTTFDAQAKMLFIQNPEPQIQSYYQEFFYSGLVLSYFVSKHHSFHFCK